ncbi:MAG: dTDP-glucose 4,6-dehydratase [Acidobacteriota bacterium]
MRTLSRNPGPQGEDESGGAPASPVGGGRPPRAISHLLVTGGGGFVGGNLVRMVLRERPAWRVTVFDSLGGRPLTPVLDGLEEAHPGRFRLIRERITEGGSLQRLLCDEGVDAVIHAAARNPSGSGAGDPLSFAEINVLGTAAVLEAARAAWAEGQGTFVHLSSYEIFGSHPEGLFTERSPLNPSTPYAASKAAADELTLAYHRTYGMRTLVTRTTNIYGPFQSPDKLIPSIALRVRDKKPLPVFGTGENRRDWIHVDDHNRGVLLALERGRAGRAYPLGARCERTNLELVREVARCAARILGFDQDEAEALIVFAPDREAHDARRALDPAASESELGFVPRIPFAEGLEEAVRFTLLDTGARSVIR